MGNTKKNIKHKHKQQKHGNGNGNGNSNGHGNGNGNGHGNGNGNGNGKVNYHKSTFKYKRETLFRKHNLKKTKNTRKPRTLDILKNKQFPRYRTLKGGYNVYTRWKVNRKFRKLIRDLAKEEVKMNKIIGSYEFNFSSFKTLAEKQKDTITNYILNRRKEIIISMAGNKDIPQFTKQREQEMSRTQTQNLLRQIGLKNKDINKAFPKFEKNFKKFKKDTERFMKLVSKFNENPDITKYINDMNQIKTDYNIIKPIIDGGKQITKDNKSILQKFKRYETDINDVSGFTKDNIEKQNQQVNKIDEFLNNAKHYYDEFKNLNTKKQIADQYILIWEDKYIKLYKLVTEISDILESTKLQIESIVEFAKILDSLTKTIFNSISNTQYKSYDSINIFLTYISITILKFINASFSMITNLKNDIKNEKVARDMYIDTNKIEIAFNDIFDNLNKYQEVFSSMIGSSTMPGGGMSGGSGRKKKTNNSNNSIEDGSKSGSDSSSENNDDENETPKKFDITQTKTNLLNRLFVIGNEFNKYLEHCKNNKIEPIYTENNLRELINKDSLYDPSDGKSLGDLKTALANVILLKKLPSNPPPLIQTNLQSVTGSQPQQLPSTHQTPKQSSIQKSSAPQLVINPNLHILFNEIQNSINSQSQTQPQSNIYSDKLKQIQNNINKIIKILQAIKKSDFKLLSIKLQELSMILISLTAIEPKIIDVNIETPKPLYREKHYSLILDPIAQLTYSPLEGSAILDSLIKDTKAEQKFNTGALLKEENDKLINFFALNTDNRSLNIATFILTKDNDKIIDKLKYNYKIFEKFIEELYEKLSKSQNNIYKLKYIYENFITYFGGANSQQAPYNTLLSNKMQLIDAEIKTKNYRTQQRNYGQPKPYYNSQQYGQNPSQKHKNKKYKKKR